MLREWKSPGPRNMDCPFCSWVILVSFLTIFIMDMGSVANLSDVHSVSILRIEVRRMSAHVCIGIVPKDPWGWGLVPGSEQ
jgi:hypothetical protein